MNIIEELQALCAKEKLLQDILPYDSEVIDKIKAELAAKKARLEHEEMDNIVFGIYELENENINFLLALYYHLRLEKVFFPHSTSVHFLFPPSLSFLFHFRKAKP